MVRDNMKVPDTQLPPPLKVPPRGQKFQSPMGPPYIRYYHYTDRASQKGEVNYFCANKFLLL